MASRASREVKPYVNRALQAYELSSVPAPLSRGTRPVRMALTVRDERGRTARLVRTLIRRPPGEVWPVRP